MEQINNIQIDDSISYPGMCRKTGAIIDNIEYLLKYSDTEAERINLCSEKVGIDLCNQLHLKASTVKLAVHDNKLCLFSQKWNLRENEQYFPLASFYEELLDIMENVSFTYSLFKEVVKKKSPNNYDDILHTFWGLFIVDYLICNYRSAGNIGFLHDGEIRLSPIFDCSTALESTYDDRYLDLSFPLQLMDFSTEEQSSYNVLMTFNDAHKNTMLEKAKELLKVEALNYATSFPEEQYIHKVILYRYKKLLEI